MSKVDKQSVMNSSVEMIRDYYEKEHKHNKDRIKYGIIAMIIIPIVFLILLFVVTSSKVVFLVMWIASLFIISGYLIAIEYKDYNMSENLKDIIGEENNDSLIDTTKFLSDIAKNYTSATDTDNAKPLLITDNNTDDTYSNEDMYTPLNYNQVKETASNDNKDYNNDKTINPDIEDNNAIHDTEAALVNTFPAVNTNAVENNGHQDIIIDNKANASTITISIDNKTNAISITINPDKEATR